MLPCFYSSVPAPRRRQQESNMQIRKIGVNSPGDMGQGIAMRLKACGYEVYAALEERSARTAELAQKAGLTDCGSLENLVSTCDAVFSVMNPGAALDAARDAAAAIRKVKKPLVYVDCNAIAPGTGLEIERLIRDAGGVFIDAGIIGS